MKVLITILMAVVSIISAGAYKYSYTFHDIPISQAIVRISKDNPDIGISFIYKELDNYKTSATINADEPYDALRQLIGLNPISVTKKDNNFFIEALQRGKFKYTGRAIGSDNEPVIAATVMLLAPKDSTIITYGLTDEAGLFSIPCDRKEVIAKLTCLGYTPAYKLCDSFYIGNIVMQELPVRLQTLKVNASQASLYSDRSVFRPTQRQKEMSQNANDLLLHIAIPQIIVDPSTYSVKTTTGQDVSIFINGVPATQQDLTGMKTTDVKKVEFLLNPQDVRFMGAPYAVNFIMQQYAWGGYSKLSANKKFCVNDTKVSVYSKFAYKKMTFDFSASDNYLRGYHYGSQLSEKFRFTDLYGNGPETVERTSNLQSSLYSTNGCDISLRALYTSNKTQVSNLLQINTTHNPHDDRISALYYADAFLPQSTTQSIASNNNYTLHNDFNFFHTFCDNLALNLELTYTYSYNSSNSEYIATDINILNNAKENSRHLMLYPYVVWRPNSHNTFMLFFQGDYAPSKVDYYGNSPSRQKYDVIGSTTGLRYTYNHTKWSVGGFLSWTYANISLTGIKNIDYYPSGNIFANYSPNSKHQMEIKYAFTKFVPETYQKSPTMLQQDQLVWYSGTPELYNTWHQLLTFSYTWIPNNIWRLNLYGNGFIVKDRVIPVYSPTGPEGTMLRKYMNNGDFQVATLGMNATARFLDGKLIANIHPTYQMYVATGEYPYKKHNPSCSAQLTWYFGNLYLSGWYVSPMKTFRVETPDINYNPTRYQLKIGWGKGAWNASLSAYNFLRTSWEDYHCSLSGPYYSSDRIVYGFAEHMQFQLTASYTFNYGKKLRKENEIDGIVTPNSTILK